MKLPPRCQDWNVGLQAAGSVEAVRTWTHQSQCCRDWYRGPAPFTHLPNQEKGSAVIHDQSAPFYVIKKCIQIN